MSTLTLSDTQLVLLSAAAQRDDGLIDAGARLKGGAARTVGEKLLALGLTEEIAVSRDAPHWRVDETGDFIGLKITARGLSALGIDGEHRAEEPDGEQIGEGDVPIPSGRPRPSRSTSKIGAVIDLLSRPGGASMNELTAATSWLPHTTRAALTGLRRKGHVISREKVDGTTRYQIEVGADQLSAEEPSA